VYCDVTGRCGEGLGKQREDIGRLKRIFLEAKGFGRRLNLMSNMEVVGWVYLVI